MIATSNEILDQLSKQFEELQSNLECYLNPTNVLNSQMISSSKMIYDQMKSHEVAFAVDAAPKQLLTRGFENEQIWQQLSLQNAGTLKATKKLLHNFDINDILLDDSESETLKEEEEDYINDEEMEDEDEFEMIEKQSDDEEFDEEDIDSDDYVEEDIEEEEDGNNKSSTNKNKQKSYKTSIVDDKFFKLRQLEEYLDNQDKLEQIRMDNEGQNVGDDESDIDDEDNIDLFAEDVSGSEMDDNENLMYKDFFDPPPPQAKSDDKTKVKTDTTKFDKKSKDNNKKKVTFEAEDDEKDGPQENDVKDESEEEDDTKKTAFERRQAEIKQKISKLEDANISSKPWQLLGETTSKVRPMNSLLEEHVAFDHTSVGTPVITEETTTSIEDIIKKRIRDQAWDDVERKVKPTIQPHEYKRAPELNMEKSKLSLAEVYEKEYMKQMEDDKEEKEDEDHVTIKKLMGKLFVKLDALSNFYFTPKPAKPDIKIITNTPSLQMEEITPITMATASQMAPEEIFEKKKGDIVGDDEKTAEDRKRQRRQKKIKKKFAAQEKEKKETLKAKTTGKTTKKKAVEQLKKGVRNTIVGEQKGGGGGSVTKNLTSSTQFFNKLQDEVTKKISDHKSKNTGPSKRKKQKTQHLKL